MYTGHCQCGGVRFQIVGELEPIQICHCSQCRRAQGAPFATNIPVQECAFTLLSGAELLKSFESSTGKHRVFCSHCGSPLYSTKDGLPGVLRIRAGLLNEPLATSPGAHIYVGSKTNWWSIHDEVPQYEAGITSAPVK